MEGSFFFGRSPNAQHTSTEELVPGRSSRNGQWEGTEGTLVPCRSKGVIILRIQCFSMKTTFYLLWDDPIIFFFQKLHRFQSVTCPSVSWLDVDNYIGCVRSQVETSCLQRHYYRGFLDQLPKYKIPILEFCVVTDLSSAWGPVRLVCVLTAITYCWSSALSSVNRERPPYKTFSVI